MNPLTEEMFVLFAILALGAWIGRLSWCGISLGTAGVLFVALIFGHFSMSVPKEVMDLGLLLFVYSVGLSAGPSFFRTFRKRGMQFVLGMAGGVFITSLLIGHFGRIGSFQLYVPPAAKNLTRELGLMLLLAGAGTNAGAHLVDVLKDRGWILLLAGAAVTKLSVLAGLMAMIKIYRLNLLSAMGALTAAMTNAPALAAARHQTETELPALSYASTYPVALIFKILLIQALIEGLRHIR